MSLELGEQENWSQQILCLYKSLKSSQFVLKELKRISSHNFIFQIRSNPLLEWKGARLMAIAGLSVDKVLPNARHMSSSESFIDDEEK